MEEMKKKRKEKNEGKIKAGKYKRNVKESEHQAKKEDEKREK